MKKTNLQFLISYLGLFPFVCVFFDIFLFNLFSISLLKNFTIFYTLLIFTYIGAMKWSFEKKLKPLIVLYGSFPSIISTFLIFFNLLGYNKNIILILIVHSLILQLILDFYFLHNKIEKFFFTYVRIPLVVLISLSICYLIFV